MRDPVEELLLMAVAAIRDGSADACIRDPATGRCWRWSRGSCVWEPITPEEYDAFQGIDEED